MNWKVPYINLKQQYLDQKAKIDKEFERVMTQGSFILRDDVSLFEQRMAEFLNVKYVIGVNSGTDALYIAARALEVSEGEEVITVAHTFVATIAAVHHAGATPVLVDISEDFNMNTSLLEGLITENTKAIIPVHMNGRMCDMDQIRVTAEKHQLAIIEDAAQALGARFDGNSSGCIGDIGCFSLHPMKILSCPGDGGFITTNSDDLHDRLRLLRNHGQRTKSEIDMYGYSSRLDNLHAAILNVKLDLLGEKIKRRRDIGSLYHNALRSLPIHLPVPPSETSEYYDVYSSYVIMTDDRNELYEHLIKNGIEVFIHMGNPIYENPNLELDGTRLTIMADCAKKILSLPIYPEMRDSDVEYVVTAIKEYYY